MRATSHAVITRGRLAEDTETNGAHEANIDHPAMTKASSPEIDIYPRRKNQMATRALIRQKRHHQILQQASRLGKSHINALGSIGRLLQEDRITAELAHINGDVQALAGEYAVHDRDILVCSVGRPAHRNDQDTALQPLVLVRG